MTADVVIPTWKARDMLARCLDALDADPSPKRVIVVDNASEDGSAELVRERGHAVVVMAENVGFGAAVNAGVAAGDGEAVVLVNNDVLVEPGFVAAICAPLADPGVGMVAGMTLLPGDGPPRVDGFGIELDPALSAYNRLRHAAPDARPGRLAVPSGGAAAYRRTAYEAAQGFDPALFAYGEDVDLGLRLLGMGWRAAEAPDARGVHLGGATVGVDSPWQRRLGSFARGFLLRRYGVLRTRAVARTLALEAAVVGYGLVRHRSVVPLTARVAGWRAGRPVRPYPRQAIDPSITTREAFRRLRTAR